MLIHEEGKLKMVDPNWLFSSLSEGALATMAISPSRERALLACLPLI
jgi:hypothetical protein